MHVFLWYSSTHLFMPCSSFMLNDPLLFFVFFYSLFSPKTILLIAINATYVHVFQILCVTVVFLFFSLPPKKNEVFTHISAEKQWRMKRKRKAKKRLAQVVRLFSSPSFSLFLFSSLQIQLISCRHSASANFVPLFLCHALVKGLVQRVKVFQRLQVAILVRP